MSASKWLDRMGGLLALVLALAATSGKAAEGGGSATYRKIQPNDVIFIRVVGEADLTMERRVGPDGTITYPYLEELTIKDKTPTEVERMVRDGLKGDYIVNPQVTVDFKEYVKEFVNVNGQVNQEGRIELPIDRKLDILDVISLARGLNLRANQDFIQLSRQGQEPKVYKYSELRAITDPAKKIYVEPGDQIWVKERVF
jgi:protein involved in polysaccharide export with SLBB domain